MLLLHRHGEDCLLVSKVLFTIILALPLNRQNFTCYDRFQQIWLSLQKFLSRILTYIQHEGKEVTQGEKWILRTDLCIRRRL
jgi:hypothetical protein